MNNSDDLLTDVRNCPTQYALAIKDTLNVLEGKWKMAIIGAMLQDKYRFNDILRTIPNLTPRMLSRELRSLEANSMVQRQVRDSVPVVIEYSLTASALHLREVLEEMVRWGLQHRAFVMKQPEQNL